MAEKAVKGNAVFRFCKFNSPPVATMRVDYRAKVGENN
jgi:hypothetical protein